MCCVKGERGEGLVWFMLGGDVGVGVVSLVVVVLLLGSISVSVVFLSSWFPDVEEFPSWEEDVDVGVDPGKGV